MNCLAALGDLSGEGSELWRRGTDGGGKSESGMSGEITSSGRKTDKVASAHRSATRGRGFAREEAGEHV